MSCSTAGSPLSFACVVFLMPSHVGKNMSVCLCAPGGGRDPAGESPVRVGGSARPVASVAGSLVTTAAKRRRRKTTKTVLSSEKFNVVEAEALRTAAGNMFRPFCEGPSLHRRSETSSSRQGSCRNLGDLMPPAVATAIPGRRGKVRSRSRIGRFEESDSCVDPMKPRTTLADRSGAESVEGRRPVEGRAKANTCSGHRAGTRMSPTACTHGPELDGPPKPRTPVASDLRQEPGAEKPHAGICAGGRR